MSKASAKECHVSVNYIIIHRYPDLTVFNGSDKFLEGLHLCRTLLYLKNEQKHLQNGGEAIGLSMHCALYLRACAYMYI